MHLDAVLAGQQLGHAGLDVVARAGVLQPGRVDHQQVRGLDLGGHLGQLERDGLVLGDRLAERLALLGVLDGQLERPDRDPARPRGDVDPADLDAVHHLREPGAALAAEDLLARRAGSRRTPARWCRRPCSPSCRSSRGRSARARPRRSRRASRPGSTVRFWCAFAAPSSVRTSTAIRFDVPPLVSHIFCAVDDGSRRRPATALRLDRRDVGAQVRLRHRERPAHLPGPPSAAGSFAFCSGVPCWVSMYATMKWVLMTPETLIQPRAISSTTRA